jgi:hypothetical protein
MPAKPVLASLQRFTAGLFQRNRPNAEVARSKAAHCLSWVRQQTAILNGAQLPMGTLDFAGAVILDLELPAKFCGHAKVDREWGATVLRQPPCASPLDRTPDLQGYASVPQSESGRA